MKASCVLVVSIMTAVAVEAAAEPEPHVRALDMISSAALARGLEESEKFRKLLDELEASDVIVHVVASPSLPTGVMGTMRFVAQIGGARYVRIDLASLAVPDVRVATLAHELQHACEVARSEAGSHDAVRRCIGHRPQGARRARRLRDRRGAPGRRRCLVRAAQLAAGQAARRPNSSALARLGGGTQACTGVSAGSTRGSTVRKYGSAKAASSAAAA